MAIRVVDVEEQPVTHLVLQRRLQRVVVGVDRVLPVTQPAVVLVQSATQASQCPAEIVDYRIACRQEGTGLPVDVFSTEQLVTGRAHIARLHHRLGQNFTLYAQVEVVHVRIPDSLREDDAGQGRLVRVARIPAVDVAGGLRPHSLVGIGCSPAEGCRYRRILKTIAGWRSAGAEAWPINNIATLL